MEKVNWSSNYSVGVGRLDEQHKQLILMINRMIGAKEAAAGSEVVSELLMHMTQYAHEHFTFEEKLLAEFGFPLHDQHKQSHIKYRKKVIDLCMAVPIGVSEVPQVILNFLVKWWLNHILQEDMEYKSFFEELGIH